MKSEIEAWLVIMTEPVPKTQFLLASCQAIKDEQMKALKSAQAASLTHGTVLRGSPTHWLLGKPEEGGRFDLRRFLPGQHLGRSYVVCIAISGGPLLPLPSLKGSEVWAPVV